MVKVSDQQCLFSKAEKHMLVDDCVPMRQMMTMVRQSKTARIVSTGRGAYLCHKHPCSSDHEQDSSANPVYQSNGHKGCQDIDNVDDAANIKAVSQEVHNFYFHTFPKKQWMLIGEGLTHVKKLYLGRAEKLTLYSVAHPSFHLPRMQREWGHRTAGNKIFLSILLHLSGYECSVRAGRDCDT